MEADVLLKPVGLVIALGQHDGDAAVQRGLEIEEVPAVLDGVARVDQQVDGPAGLLLHKRDVQIGDGVGVALKDDQQWVVATRNAKLAGSLAFDPVARHLVVIGNARR